MPCDKEVNITFKAGGLSYHVHPLDATMEPSDLGLEAGKNCIGMVSPTTFLSFSVLQSSPVLYQFQPIAASAANPDIDMILGMAFCKSYLWTMLSPLPDNVDRSKECLPPG
jgi:hypothetical protein